MTPNAVTLLFKEARDAFPPIEGKPTDDDLLSSRETLLPILMEVPYDQLGGVHSTATIATLTATNKKLVDAGRGRGTPAGGTPAGKPAEGGRSTKTPHPGNYCWTHGHRISREHTSATCANKATGHCDDATAANTFGSSEKDKGWASAST